MSLAGDAVTISRAAIWMVPFVVAASTSGCAAPSTHESCGPEGNQRDADVTASVLAILNAHADIPMGGITVQTLGCRVYLYGIVDTELERRNAVSLARGVPGVTSVVDSIGVRNGVY
jgi:osmotically-inducible protein OsmY